MSLTLNVLQDFDPIDPREDENLGTMMCAHSRHKLGDEQIESGKYESWDDAQEHIVPKNATVLPLYLYDHSGITMNTTGFSCQWDSGQVGFIYVSDELARTLLGWKSITKGRREKIKEYLRNEVESYDKYLRGDIWGWEIKDENDEVIDCCYGYEEEESAREDGELTKKSLVKEAV